MSERMIRHNGLVIATEAFGDPTDPPVLLLMGGGSSMLWWPEAFRERLAAHGRYVIRYDQRETGLSTHCAPGDPPYTLDDLAADAIRILDGYGIPAAHVVSMSLGGAVGQLVALQSPTRVLSLTVISSSPFGIDTSHLPGSGEAYNAHLASAEAVDWSDREQAIAFLVADSRLTAGTDRAFDEVQVRAFMAEDYDRAGGQPSMSNFSWRGGEQWRGRLHELKAPLLVIHGTVDPVYPIEHGIALSEAVPGARLVRLEGGGHELHPADWDMMLDAIVAHTSLA